MSEPIFTRDPLLKWITASDLGAKPVKHNRATPEGVPSGGFLTLRARRKKARRRAS